MGNVIPNISAICNFAHTPNLIIYDVNGSMLHIDEYAYLSSRAYSRELISDIRGFSYLLIDALFSLVQIYFSFNYSKSTSDSNVQSPIETRQLVQTGEVKIQENKYPLKTAYLPN